jgi:hypothetical protein
MGNLLIETKTPFTRRSIRLIEFLDVRVRLSDWRYSAA